MTVSFTQYPRDNKEGHDNSTLIVARCIRIKATCSSSSNHIAQLVIK